MFRLTQAEDDKPNMLAEKDKPGNQLWSRAIMSAKSLEPIGNVEGNGRNHDRIARMTCKFGSHSQPAHDSWFEIRFDVEFPDPLTPRRIQKTAMGVRFNRLNLTNPVQYANFRTFGQEKLAEFRELFQLTDGVDERIANNGLWYVKLKCKSDFPWAYNLFNDSELPGDLGTIKTALQNLFSTGTSDDPLEIRLCVSAENLSNVKTVNGDIAKMLTVNPRDKWYPMSRPSKIATPQTLQWGLQLPAASRPTYRTHPSLTYQEWNDYVTVLGHAVIQDFEFAAKKCIPRLNVDARLFGLSGFGNRKYLLLLDLPKESAGFTVGDRVEVNFDPSHDLSSHYWQGKVIPAITYQDITDTALLVDRPLVADPENPGDVVWRTFKPEIYTFSDVTSLNMPLDARTQLRSAVPRKVNIRMDCSNVVGRHQISALATLTSGRGRHGPEIYAEARQIFMGSKPSSLARRDIFATVPSGVDIEKTLFAIEQQDQLDNHQREVLNKARSAAGGTIILGGPPGSGKTKVMMSIAKALYTIKKKTLIVGPTNAIVDKLALQARDALLQFGATHTACPIEHLVVIRSFSPNSEEAILLKDANSNRSSFKSPPYHQQEDETNISKLSAARSLMEQVHTAMTHNSAVDLVPDVRVTQPMLELSLGHHMALVAGLFGEHPLASLRESLSFRGYYARWKNNELFEPDEEATFASVTMELHDYVLGIAHVVVTTFTGAASPKLGAFRPYAVLVDEASKATDADLWPLWSSNYALFHFLFGDHHQLGPTVLSMKTNNFASQLQTSLHARGRAFGLDYINLVISHRFGRQVGKLVQVLYNGSDAFELDPTANSHPNVEIIRNFMGNTFQLMQNICLVEVEGAKCSSVIGQTSKYNEALAAVCAWILEKVICDGTINLRDVGLISPYQAQYELHMRTKAILKRRYPDVNIDDLYVGKFDSFQGNERSLMIIDMVISDSMGFLSEPNRIYAAFSRAKHGVITVYSPAIQAARHWRGSKAEAIIDAHKRDRAVYRFPRHDYCDLEYFNPFGAMEKVI